MSAETDTIKPCLIHIDKEGRWTHKGTEMIRRDMIQLFYKNMELDQEGHYVVNWQGERCYVDVEDTAFVVTRARFEKETANGTPGFVLTLSDGTQENLLPETLCTGNRHVLYCRVKNNGFPARFLRPAYYQLAEHVEEENGRYVIPLDGKKFLIKPCMDSKR